MTAPVPPDANDERRHLPGCILDPDHGAGCVRQQWAADDPEAPWNTRQHDGRLPCGQHAYGPDDRCVSCGFRDPFPAPVPPDANGLREAVESALALLDEDVELDLDDYEHRIQRVYNILRTALLAASEAAPTAGEHDHTFGCLRCETSVGECCPHCPAAISRAEVNQSRREARAFGEADE